MKKENIKKLVKKYQTRFGLDNWDIQVKFKLLEKRTKKKTFVTTAEMDCDVEYLMATLTFNTDMLHKVGGNDIIHELIHIVLSEYRRFCKQHINEKHYDGISYLEEKATVTLERIFLRNEGKK